MMSTQLNNSGFKVRGLHHRAVSLTTYHIQTEILQLYSSKVFGTNLNKLAFKSLKKSSQMCYLQYGGERSLVAGARQSYYWMKVCVKVFSILNNCTLEFSGNMNMS